MRSTYSFTATRHPRKYRDIYFATQCFPFDFNRGRRPSASTTTICEDLYKLIMSCNDKVFLSLQNEGGAK